ncbi:MAG TPA: peptidyl-prolyl cis-trans isomerase [Gemmataceae bacterium]|nr:peptidyl-prolyl cis-trans isomerase [Gemmataceae bacterium]
MALVRPSAVAAALTAALAGCAGPITGTQQAYDENRKMDCLIRCREELEQKAARPILVARSQSPEVLTPVRLGNPVRPSGPALPPPPTTEPAAPATGIRLPDLTPAAPTPTPTPVKTVAGTGPSLPTAPAATEPKLEGDTQVRIVASLGNNPIYESEVREAVYQRLGELVRLPEPQRAAREKEIFREELRRIIERELVLDEMTANLTQRKQTAALAKLKQEARKEADSRVKEFKKERDLATDEEFKAVLRSQGLTLTGIKRQIERGFMMQTYLREAASKKLDNVGLADVREYFATHPDEFKAEDRVKWQDLFVLTERFKTPAEAKHYADVLAARAARGDDFGKLASEYGMGDSKFRNGAGIGEKPGEIFPQELEPTLLALTAGQVTVKQTETGYHVLKVSERTKAGVRPYDEKLQGEIRRKLQNQLYDQESRRLINSLWKQAQPQIWVDR